MWHVCVCVCGGGKRNTCRVLVGKPEGNRPVAGREARRDEATRVGDETVNVLQNRAVQGADKSLARQGRKQATATAEFEFHISYL